MGTVVNGAKNTQNTPSTATAASAGPAASPVLPLPPQPKQPLSDPQAAAKQAEASRQHATENKGQAHVRGRMLQQKLGKQLASNASTSSSSVVVPSPADLARSYEGVKGAKASHSTLLDSSHSPATSFSPNKSAVQKGDGRASASVEYQKLPEDLKGKLNQQFWGGLGKEQRQSLIETYGRMKGYGLWDQVKRVIGEKNPPEPRAKTAGLEFKVAGNSGGIVFEAKDAAILEKKLKATGHFGEDGPIIGSEHRGQRSNREWSSDHPGSLHLSIGPGNTFDTHIDKVSPTSQPVDGKTRIDPRRGPMHHSQELWPEKIRNRVGVPGVIIDGSVVENKHGWHGAEARVGIRMEVHGPVKKEVVLPKSGPDSPNAAPGAMLDRISKRLEKAQIYFPTPIGSNPDDVPMPGAVATRMAAEMLEAARNGNGSIELNLPLYLDKKGDQPAALAAMKEIGEIVRSETIAARAAMPEAERSQIPELDDVRRLTVMFGARTQGGTVLVTND